MFGFSPGSSPKKNLCTGDWGIYTLFLLNIEMCSPACSRKTNEGVSLFTPLLISLRSNRIALFMGWREVYS